MDYQNLANNIDGRAAIENKYLNKSFRLLLLVILYFVPFPLQGAWAHGTSNVDGQLQINPKNARPGEMVNVSVSLRELEAGVLKKAKLYVEVKAGKGTETIELVPTSYNTFSNHFRLREGFHDLRVVMVRSD
ncbi:MAG: hypothetical protein V3T23_06295 [Nitrososphaerales archaeon]